MKLTEPAHRTIEVKRGHATDEVTLNHDCPASGAQEARFTSQTIAVSGSDVAIVNLGAVAEVMVTGPACGLVAVDDLRGRGASDHGR